MDNLIMLATLIIVIIIYFLNNPVKHSKEYRIRCFLNWLPLGLSYAFLYMARYNLTVSKNAFGSIMTKADFGTIFGWGAAIYALSFLINGPIIDKIGGKRGILIGMAGAILANIALGVYTYKVLTTSNNTNLVLFFSVFYCLNMYFQSYGAAAIIKVN